MTYSDVPNARKSPNVQDERLEEVRRQVNKIEERLIAIASRLAELKPEHQALAFELMEIGRLWGLLPQDIDPPSLSDEVRELIGSDLIAHLEQAELAKEDIENLEVMIAQISRKIATHVEAQRSQTLPFPGSEQPDIQQAA